MKASNPSFEEARLATLYSLKVLDTLPEWEFDGLVEIARTLLDVPIALVSLVDEDRQWFKARVGLDVSETARDLAFCAHTILQDEALVVPDARLDPRFADNPLVSGGLGIRFYSGAPIVVEGQPVGTVCCIDLRPRRPAARQIGALAALAAQASRLFEARLREARFEQSERRFAAFLDHSPTLTFLKDGEGRMRYSNRRHAEAFGYEKGAIVGTLDHERMPTPFAERLRQHDDHVRRTGETIECEEVMLLPDGTPAAWKVHKFPLEIEGETWVGGVAIDVTAQRENEETMRRQKVELSQALEGAEAAMEAAMEAVRFKPLFAGLPVACYTHDEHGTVVDWNEAAEKLWSLSRAEAFGRSVYDIMGERNREAKRATVARVFAGESVEAEESCIATSEGETRWLLTNTFPLRNSAGMIVGAVSANVDITERKRVESALRASEGRLHTVVDSLYEGLTVQDASGAIVLWNESAERILGLTPDQISGRTPTNPFWRSIHEDGSLYSADDHPTTRALATGDRQAATTMGVHLPDGTTRWLEVNASPLCDEDGEARNVVASFVDITDRLAQERRIEAYSRELEAANGRLENLATTDGLTGLKNHRFFQDFLRRRIEQCGALGMPLSVALLDVDHFKSYNDDFGHQAGDAVLRDVADLLSRSVRDSDLVARYGGEEFVIVMPGLDAANALAMADRVRERLAAAPFGLRAVTASFGVATLGRPPEDAPSLVKAADEALYRSKAAGRNRATHWLAELAEVQAVKDCETVPAPPQGEGASIATITECVVLFFPSSPSPLSRPRR